MNHSLVSVIIPVYNVTPYLREALDSVVNQTYRNLEIIVVDDGSTDGSGEICDEYRSDSRVHVFHQKNRGQSVAKNMGLDYATGDYIAFLDSDDAYHPDFVRLMLDAIEDVDVVECPMNNCQITMDSRSRIVSLSNEGVYDRVQALRGFISGEFSGSACNKLFRKELWKKIRFPEGHFYEDGEVVSNIFNLINWLYYLDQPLYFYRKRHGSTTHTFSSGMAADFLLSRNHIVSFVESHIPEVYDETHLNIVRELQMNGMVMFYSKGAVDIKDLQSACEAVNPKKLCVRGRVVYSMIFGCPWLLKVFYPIYHRLRMFG